MKLRQEINNTRDMIDGELNRIMVTDDIEEIRGLTYYLFCNINDLIRKNQQRIAKSLRGEEMIDCSKQRIISLKAKNDEKRKLYAGIYKCELDCSDCPLSSLNNDATDKMTCGEFETLCPEQAIEVVQRWSDEHPGKPT